MKTMKKTTIKYLIKNEKRIEVLTKKAEKALLEKKYIDCFAHVANIHKLKDIIRTLKHEPQHNVGFNKIVEKWNEIKLPYGTEKEYAIRNNEILEILLSM